MTGRLIAIVGPSGVGKDSVMDALAAADARLSLVRRVITRAQGAGGEDFTPVTPAQFDTMRARGDFALHWGAHGLLYGVPAQVRGDLAAGRDLLVNLSRAVLPQAAALFDPVIIALTAKPDVLAARLAARGRETQADIAQRLARADFALPAGVQAHQVDNSGDLATTVAQILALVYPARS